MGRVTQRRTIVRVTLNVDGNGAAPDTPALDTPAPDTPAPGEARPADPPTTAVLGADPPTTASLRPDPPTTAALRADPPTTAAFGADSAHGAALSNSTRPDPARAGTVHAGSGPVDSAQQRAGFEQLRLDGSVQVRQARDSLAAEEPLEIRVGAPLAVTMRTPGDDLDLAIGFLLTEGIIRGAAEVRTARLCAGDQEPNTYNVVDVVLADGVAAPDQHRNFYTTSSCGVCGKASIDAVRTRSVFDVTADGVSVTPAVLATLPDALRRRQRAFATTGGLHAAGLFTAAGELVCLREDVGRHNAVDKVIGWAVRQGRLPLAGHVLMVSGRASFELCQKAWMAGIPVLAAVSAPSTLAVDLAEEAGLTLVGFLRGPTFNIYAGAQRVRGVPAPQPARAVRPTPTPQISQDPPSFQTSRGSEEPPDRPDSRGVPEAGEAPRGGGVSGDGGPSRTAAATAGATGPGTAPRT